MLIRFNGVFGDISEPEPESLTDRTLRMSKTAILPVDDEDEEKEPFDEFTGPLWANA